MLKVSSIETMLRRDRLLISLAILVLAAGAWLDMTREARTLAATGVCQCLGMKMGGPDTQSWGLTEAGALFFMWAEMMMAMMLPTVAPMLLIFARVNRQRLDRHEPFVPTALFLLGYLVVWALFSMAATFLQWRLHAWALLSPNMVATSPILAGA